jgi:hypothetical protein
MQAGHQTEFFVGIGLQAVEMSTTLRQDTSPARISPRPRQQMFMFQLISHWPGDAHELDTFELDTFNRVWIVHSGQ